MMIIIMCHIMYLCVRKCTETHPQVLDMCVCIYIYTFRYVYVWSLQKDRRHVSER